MLWQRANPIAPDPNHFAERPLLALLQAAAARDPDAIAVADGAVRVTYAEFLTLAAHAARRIATLAQPGDAVALIVPDSVSGLACTLGCMTAGRVCISLDPAQPAERLTATLRDAAPAAIIRPEDMVNLLNGPTDVLPLGDTDPDAPAAVHYTSGSSGRPKGIVTSRYATLRRAEISMLGWQLASSDRLLGVFNMSGNNALSRHLAALCSGARLILCDLATDGPDALLGRMTQERCTILAVGPAILRAMLVLPAVRHAFSHLRILQVGGAALLPADVQAAQALLPPHCQIVHTYASTEAGIVAHWVIPPDFHSDEPRLPSGYFAEAQDYALTDTSELVVRSRCVANGEWEDGHCVQGRMVTDAADPLQRIFHTGDTMRVGADGLLRFVGRTDSLVKINGVRVELGEIEAAIRRDPAVADAAIVPSLRGPEYRLTAYAAAPGADPLALARALAQRLRTELPSAMRPSRIVVLDALPRLVGGKVDIWALPEPADTPYRAPRDPREAALCRIFGELTGHERPGIDDDFFALGGDSLAGMRLISLVRDELGYTCPLHLLYAHPTPARLASVLDTAPGYTPLVALRADGDRSPLFCVHPAGGYAVAFHHLAAALPSRLPVWGLQAKGMETNEVPHASIAEMTEAYLAAIRAVQPVGPYRLLGWSIGGMIAHEMACRLEGLGQTVSHLCILDTPAFPAPPPAPPPKPNQTTIDARTARLLRAQAIERGLLPADTPADWGARIMEQLRLGKPRLEMHQAGQCQAPILLIRAGLEPASERDAEAFAWEKLTDGTVERITVPCLHTQLGDARHAAAIAAAVLERLAPG